MNNFLLKIATICFVFLLIHGALNLVYSSSVTGNVLVAEWREYKKYQAGMDYNTVYFVAYKEYVNKNYPYYDRKAVALPSNVTDNQIYSVVGKWLEEHPEEWNKPGKELISKALIKAFPKQYVMFGFIDFSDNGIANFINTSAALILNAILGVITSIVGWFILFRMLVPKIKFSKKINKIPSRNGDKSEYRIKFKNLGQRNAIDIEVFARLRIRNLSKSPRFKSIWTIVTLHTKTSYVVHLAKQSNRILYLYLNDTKELHTSKFINALQGKELTLENLLSLGEKTELSVWALAYDEFSGSRKAFVSKNYRLCDISEGKFGGDDKLDVIPQCVEKTRMPLIKNNNYLISLLKWKKDYLL